MYIYLGGKKGVESCEGEGRGRKGGKEGREGEEAGGSEGGWDCI